MVLQPIKHGFLSSLLAASQQFKQKKSQFICLENVYFRRFICLDNFISIIFVAEIQQITKFYVLQENIYQNGLHAKHVNLFYLEEHAR